MATRRSSPNPGRAKPPASGTLPAHGRRMLAAAYESAKARALAEGSSAKSAKARASAQAWCAVKRHYHKRGAKWIRRKVPLGPGEQPPGCTPRRRRKNPSLSPAEREILKRLADKAEQTGDDWGTIDAINDYLKHEEYDEQPIKYLRMVDQDIDWNYGHAGDDDDPAMDRASANRAHEQIADAIVEIKGLQAGGAYQQALASINRDRARRGERALDPRAAGWTAEDVHAEAKRIAKNPEKLEHGVFHWRADGRYKRSEAVKIYKRMADADRMADKAYAADKRSDLVVRPSNYWVSENPSSPEIVWNLLPRSDASDPPGYESDPVEVDFRDRPPYGRSLAVFRLWPATAVVRNKYKPVKFGKQLGYDTSVLEVLEVGTPGHHKWGEGGAQISVPLVLDDAKRAVALWLEGMPFNSDNGRIADVFPAGYSTPKNPRDYDEDDEDEDDEDEDDEDEDDGRDAYGIREPKDWELHQAESDLVLNPSIWVVVAPENKDLWPTAPLEVVTRERALDLTHGRPRYIAIRTGFASEGQARSYADKIEHATIEVSRPSDGTVVYRGPLLGFSDDPASHSLAFVDRGRLLALADSQIEVQLGRGKKALIARRERSGNPPSRLSQDDVRSMVQRAVDLSKQQGQAQFVVLPFNEEREIAYTALREIAEREYDTGLAIGFDGPTDDRGVWAWRVFVSRDPMRERERNPRSARIGRRERSGNPKRYGDAPGVVDTSWSIMGERDRRTGWPTYPFDVMPRGETIAYIHMPPGYTPTRALLRSALPTEAQARAYLDKAKQTGIEVTGAGGQVLYQGPILDLARDKLASRIYWSDINEIVDGRDEIRFGKGKKALTIRRMLPAASSRQRNPRTDRVGRRIASGGC